MSFSGEVTYEINVAWSCGRDVWESVMRAGEQFGIELVFLRKGAIPNSIRTTIEGTNVS